MLIATLPAGAPVVVVQDRRIIVCLKSLYVFITTAGVGVDRLTAESSPVAGT